MFLTHSSLIHKIFNYFINKIRIFKLYYVLQKIRLNNLIKDQSITFNKVNKYNFRIDFKNFRSKKFYKNYDSKELNYSKLRCNQFFEFKSNYILVDSNILKIHKKINFNSIDTYTLSEISSNLVLYSFITKSKLNKNNLVIYLNKIESKLEFHFSKNTNNHFFNNIRACILLSLYLKDKKKLIFYLKCMNFFFLNFVSDRGILIFEKSNNYQSLFTIWIIELYFILKYNGYAIKELDIQINLCMNIVDKLIYLNNNNAFIGDISPDKTTNQILKRLIFWKKLKGDKSVNFKNNFLFFDKRSKV